MAVMKRISKQSILHLALMLVVIAFWAVVELLGPVLYIFEESFLLLDVVRVTGHALFHAGLIFALLSLLGKGSFVAFVTLTTLYIPLAYVNLLYFRSFGICFPFNMMLEFQQLQGLNQSIVELMRWYDMLFLIVPIVMIFAYRWLSTRLQTFSYKLHYGLLALYLLLTLCPVLYVINYRQFDITKLHGQIHENYAMAPKRTYRGFGLLPSLSYQIWNRSQIVEPTEHELAQIDNLIEAQHAYFDRAYTNTSAKTNCVILLLESFSSQAIHPHYMPVLHELCRQNSTLYCPKVKQLTQGGKSIGGQLVVMTGLHGLRNSTFVTDFRSNSYPSIASAMRDRSSDCYTFSVVSTDTNFWQQDVVNRQLGVEGLYGLRDIKAEYEEPCCNKHKWIDDKSLFSFAAEKIEGLNTPFCCVVVPSNMHSPYSYDSAIDCNANFEELEDGELHEYMRRANYLDRQIGTLIERLKECGKYEDTLIIVTSDHHVPYVSEAMNAALTEYIPAIFINTAADWGEQNRRNEGVVFCHSQLYPTALQLMGLHPEGYIGLFPPMTDVEATAEYGFDSCDYATTTNEQLKLVYDLGELIVRSNHFERGK